MPMPLEPTPLSTTAQAALFSPERVKDATQRAMLELGEVATPTSNKDGEIELLDDFKFTHHFIDAPGDKDFISWHYVTTGEAKNEAVVFVHGIPDSWFMWHHQMAALAKEGYYCVGVDLKGFGQSGKEPGDYRVEGVAEQLHDMLELTGVNKFYLVSHDRGAVVADYLVAQHPQSVRAYARCEQHLYHFNPLLSRHLDLMREAPYNHMLDDPKQVVCMAYRGMNKGIRVVPIDELRRSVQEFSYAGIDRAVVRYLDASTVEQETKHRRRSQLAEWRCPIVLIIGGDSPTQPQEFFVDAGHYIPNAAIVEVKVIEDAGHFFPMEWPDKATKAIRHMLALGKGSQNRNLN